MVNKLILNKKYILLFIVILFGYYQFDYKRYFIESSDGKKVFTVWQRKTNNCYIILGKYYSPFKPSKNYIQTKNYRNYIDIIFNPSNRNYADLSIYNDFEKHNLKLNISIFSNNDSMMYKYGILKKYDPPRGIRVVAEDKEILKKKYDYVSIDLNRIYGIKITRP
ncbi:hypothetical protein [Chryseobacterium taiwanense]|uniref:Uncharacterized protein n=1 Tax=Chryseobacterium taiwanense TaxID=363331 RepID=A0A0B4E645_9FLAO|nr:hypothetical protein [Chryseobacterium taiwanense]KIC62103.1 hypothetical protein RM51_13635 [Chryseobacterium taiwanense]